MSQCIQEAPNFIQLVSIWFASNRREKGTEINWPAEVELLSLVSRAFETGSRETRPQTKTRNLSFCWFVERSTNINVHSAIDYLIIKRYLVFNDYFDSPMRTQKFSLSRRKYLDCNHATSQKWNQLD